MFKSASDAAFEELEARRGSRNNLLKFGVQYLDDAMIGIQRDDLVLIGADTGIGKTQLCCMIALTNLADGKRVHFMALEASKFEIERRLKYQLVASMFFADKNRPDLGARLSYDRWLLGDFIEVIRDYEQRAAEFFSECFKNLFLYYKGDSFTIHDMLEQTLSVSGETDLFLVDHAHYFDFDDDNENRAMKQLAKSLRSLVLDEQVPVILVAHLRKRDRNNPDLVPDLHEFHGSSDLAKIATKVITVAPGGRTRDGCYETFFRTPKSRLNGGAKFFIGRVIFNPKQNAYEKEYKIGRASLNRKDGFEELDSSDEPDWFNGRPKMGSSLYPTS